MNTEILSFDALVVGTGAAGYQAACQIRRIGQKSVAVITEGIFCGTSRNTGSDKQTYYKLGLGGDTLDSVHNMAENLFSSGCVDGDSALCEAALSSRCFLNLCDLGVPFPVNRYGEYVGYKTDHDPFARATSAGPLTSKFMTEALQKQAENLNIAVFDHLYAVEVLKNKDGVLGLLCLDQKTGDFVSFRAGNIILATGGPAGIYADSVYPVSQNGSTSLALLAGASLQNMTEWQYGLSSVSPRWNVSGTYMQVLPRMVSVDSDGTEHEFLFDYFSDPYEGLSMLFLKGYQWPFDCKKVMNGSSVIDLLVYREQVLYQRKVYLDYMHNPMMLENIDYPKLSKEAKDYLENAHALFGTPLDRLNHMNRPAAELYAGKGRRLDKEYLEIALCAQHHNGGISVDLWWQTCVPGLFAAGECAGTHGITRPGGSALNAGQVGGMRAAQYISQRGRSIPDEASFEKANNEALLRHQKLCEKFLSSSVSADNKIRLHRRKMSDCAAAVRNLPDAEKYLEEVQKELDQMNFGVRKPSSLYKVYQLRDLLFTQTAVLTAVTDYAKKIQGSRGSALYSDPQGKLRNGLEDMFRFQCANDPCPDQIQQISFKDHACTASWRSVRPLPKEDNFFENIWKQYRENKNIY